MSRNLSRRQLLVGGAAALGGLSGLPTARAADGAEGTADVRLFGVMQQSDLPRALRMRSDGTKIVEFVDDALFWKGTGLVTSDAFEVGDEVVATGQWREPGTFLAKRLEPAYRELRGRVVSRKGSELVLSGGGRVVLGRYAVPWGRWDAAEKRLDEIGVGDELVGTALWNPRLQGLEAVRVGIKAA